MKILMALPPLDTANIKEIHLYIIVIVPKSFELVKPRFDEIFR